MTQQKGKAYRSKEEAGKLYRWVEPIPENLPKELKRVITLHEGEGDSKWGWFTFTGKPDLDIDMIKQYGVIGILQELPDATQEKDRQDGWTDEDMCNFALWRANLLEEDPVMMAQSTMYHLAKYKENHPTQSPHKTLEWPSEEQISYRVAGYEVLYKKAFRDAIQWLKSILNK